MATAISSGGVQAATDVQDVPAGDGIGTGTIGGIGVPTVRIIPPVIHRFTRCTGISYDNAGTAHTITFMTPIGDVSPKVTADLAINGTTIPLDAVPHDGGGNVPASGDWLCVRGTDNQLYSYQVASYAAGVITITATSGYGDANGTGLAMTIPTGNQVWFYGSPAVLADQPRRLISKASTVNTIVMVLATTPKVYQPILVYSDNGTAPANSIYLSGDNPKAV